MTVIKALNIQDKAAMINLASNMQMFAEEEITFIAEIFDNKNNDSIWLGAFVQDAMVGTAYCAPMEMTNKTWNILMLLVHPNHRRQAIGKSLMQEVENILSVQNQRLIIVETSSTDNFKTARDFYEAIGYIGQGAITDFYDNNDHKITYTKLIEQTQS